MPCIIVIQHTLFIQQPFSIQHTSSPHSQHKSNTPLPLLLHPPLLSPTNAPFPSYLLSSPSSPPFPLIPLPSPPLLSSPSSPPPPGGSRATPPRQRIRKDVLPVINYPLNNDDRELCEIAAELLDDLPRLPVTYMSLPYLHPHMHPISLLSYTPSHPLSRPLSPSLSHSLTPPPSHTPPLSLLLGEQTPVVAGHDRLFVQRMG